MTFRLVSSIVAFLCALYLAIGGFQGSLSAFCAGAGWVVVMINELGSIVEISRKKIRENKNDKMAGSK